MSLSDRVLALVVMIKCSVAGFLHDEEGDTNFISILVLLGIALALAGVFLTFKNQILSWVDQNIGDFFSQSGGRG